MNQSLLLACGPSGGVLVVLLGGLVVLGTAGLLWIANLCLSLCLNTLSQQMGHFLFALSCLGAEMLLYVTGQSANNTSISLAFGVLVVPSVVIAHFIWLLAIRRRQSDAGQQT